MEAETKEIEVAQNLNELKLDKRQKSFVGLVECADGSVVPASTRNAWPDFIPEEAVERIASEGRQMEQIQHSEL